MRSNDLKEVVCLHDPAIDPHCPLGVYGVSRDLGHLRFREGMTPTRYFVRRLPRSLLLRTVDVGDDDRAKWVRAFVLGVERVNDCEVEPGVVRTVVPSQEIDTPGGKLRVWSDEDLEKLPSVDDIYDIGSVVYGRAFLRRGSRDCYQPPHTWRVAMQRRVFQDAELTQVVQRMTTTDAPVSPGSETTRPDSDDESAQRTAATATGPSSESTTTG